MAGYPVADDQVQRFGQGGQLLQPEPACGLVENVAHRHEYPGQVADHRHRRGDQPAAQELAVKAQGIDEQEQKGVTAPKTDASRCANSFGCFSIYFLNLLLSM